jgi:uncharacterized repeat protein (TIGR01451 family)
MGCLFRALVNRKTYAKLIKYYTFNYIIRKVAVVYIREKPVMTETIRFRLKLFITFLVLSVFLLNISGAVSADGREQIEFENPVITLENPEPNDDDAFGQAVDASGDTVAVADDEYVFLFERDAGGADNWGQVNQISSTGGVIALDGDTLYANGSLRYRDQGGSDNWGEVLSIYRNDLMAAALDGDTLAVAYSDSAGGTKNVDIFYRDHPAADNWGLITTIVSSEPTFGTWIDCVDLSGDLLVVGAPGAAVGGINPGAVYVYSRNQSGADQWGQLTMLTAPDGVDDDNFGDSVVVNGRALAVGAPWRSYGSSSYVGAVYIFFENEGGNGNWGLRKVLYPPHPNSFQNFGAGLALSGDILLVGYGLDTFAIFKKPAWELTGESLISPSETVSTQYRADAVDISGDVIVIGDSWDGSGFSRIGKAFIWTGYPADLDLAKTVSADQVTAGESLTYTLTVTNNSSHPALNLEVRDYLPNGVTLVSVTGVGWSCTSADQQVSCTLPNLAPGAVAEDIMIEVLTSALSVGWVNNVASVTSENLELDFDNNQQVELTEVIAIEYRSYLPLALR